VCVDPARPYCDFDGLIEGKPDACIAVECVGGQLEACRGDTAVKCDQSGGDLVDVECPLGCDPASNGCRECTNNVQCAAKPVCDPESSLCRECRLDDECDSRVCSNGSCLAESDIVYASPSGFGTCSKNQPCNLQTGVMTALSNANKVLRMLPGTYASQLDVHLATPTPLQIVATGATVSTIGDMPAIAVAGGAAVKVRGLSSISERHLKCGAASAAVPLSKIEFEGGVFTTVGSTALLEIERCDARFVGARITSASNTSSGIYSDGTLTFDRVEMSTDATQNITVVNAPVHAF
jgi:hypothetical protein